MERTRLTNANPLPESHGGEHASHFARYQGFDEVKLQTHTQSLIEGANAYLAFLEHWPE